MSGKIFTIVGTCRKKWSFKRITVVSKVAAENVVLALRLVLKKIDQDECKDYQVVTVMNGDYMQGEEATGDDYVEDGE